MAYGPDYPAAPPPDGPPGPGPQGWQEAPGPPGQPGWAEPPPGQPHPGWAEPPPGQPHPGWDTGQAWPEAPGPPGQPGWAEPPPGWQPVPAGQAPVGWEDIPHWRERRGWQLLVVPLLVGSLVAVTLGVYARLHEPQGISVNVAGFSGPLEAKVWLASGAALLALLQLISSLVMYGKVPGLAALPPAVVGGLHRWSGRIAFLLTIPVAIHCLYAVGFQTGTARALGHSVLGCLFFGAFVVKMLGLRKDNLPGWALPALGGLVFTSLIGLWLTSSLWYFSTFGVQV